MGIRYDRSPSMPLPDIPGRDQAGSGSVRSGFKKAHPLAVRPGPREGAALPASPPDHCPGARPARPSRRARARPSATAAQPRGTLARSGPPETPAAPRFSRRDAPANAHLLALPAFLLHIAACGPRGPPREPRRQQPLHARPRPATPALPAPPAPPAVPAPAAPRTRTSGPEGAAPPHSGPAPSRRPRPLTAAHPHSRARGRLASSANGSRSFKGAGRASPALREGPTHYPPAVEIPRDGSEHS